MMLTGCTTAINVRRYINFSALCGLRAGSGAVAHCAGHLRKPTFEATWRNLQASVELLANSRQPGNIEAAKKMHIYLEKIVPSHEKPPE